MMCIGIRDTYTGREVAYVYFMTNINNDELVTIDNKKHNRFNNFVRHINHTSPRFVILTSR